MTGGRSGRQSHPAKERGWDATKDRELFVAKVQNADKNEGYTIRLMSYDGAEPKLELTRSYKLATPKDGKSWFKELPKEVQVAVQAQRGRGVVPGVRLGRVRCPEETADAGWGPVSPEPQISGGQPHAGAAGASQKVRKYNPATDSFE